MTIIVVKGRAMAADGAQFSGGMMAPAKFPKIWRGPNGLLGLCGGAADCYRVYLWFKDGMDPLKKPLGLLTGDDAICGLLLDSEGLVWFIDGRLILTPDNNPTSAGVTTACAYAMGAMAQGASAGEAVGLAVLGCVHVGPPVQVETL